MSVHEWHLVKPVEKKVTLLSLINAGSIAPWSESLDVQKSSQKLKTWDRALIYFRLHSGSALRPCFAIKPVTFGLQRSCMCLPMCAQTPFPLPVLKNWLSIGSLRILGHATDQKQHHIYLMMLINSINQEGSSKYILVYPRTISAQIIAHLPVTMLGTLEIPLIT